MLEAKTKEKEKYKKEISKLKYLFFISLLILKAFS
jgi:hypothetical protein